MESAVTATALAAATTSGTAAYRRVPARHGHYVRLAAALAAAITGGSLIDALLDLPTSRIRRRLNGLDDSTPTDNRPPDSDVRAGAEDPDIKQEDAAPELSDAEIIQRLEHTVASDAASRAADHGWCRAHADEKYLTSRKHWQGHPDGTASLPLVAGCTLHFEPHNPAETDLYPEWRQSAFVLDDNGTRIEVATPAALLAHLTGRIDLSNAGDGGPYGELAFADFDAGAEGGACARRNDTA
ncbi:hypothetical protein ACPXCO_23230 [Streptomyces cyaneofuscatus]|uniref:hypothetical protein n=1 Tax=Streptomyces cyaneofuscatus TaxID=66883 RepID=UPI003CEF424E